MIYNFGEHMWGILIFSILKDNGILCNSLVKYSTLIEIITFLMGFGPKFMTNRHVQGLPRSTPCLYVQWYEQLFFLGKSLVEFALE
jgi:hypothetical protein